MSTQEPDITIEATDDGRYRVRVDRPGISAVSAVISKDELLAKLAAADTGETE